MDDYGLFAMAFAVSLARKRGSSKICFKVSFGRAIMQALELLRMAKRHVSGQNDVEQ